jgi:hypothetical protein
MWRRFYLTSVRIAIRARGECRLRTFERNLRVIEYHPLSPDLLMTQCVRSAIVCAALISAACGSGGSGTTAPSSRWAPLTAVPGASRLAGDYLNEILATMQAHSINRAKIDWVAFRAQVVQTGQSAQAIVDLYPAISIALGLLDDRHSFYQATGGCSRSRPSPSSISRTHQTTRATDGEGHHAACR